MVDLTHINLATKEDRAYGIEHWARLFKASTWEELKMIANGSQVLTEASKALYQLNAQVDTLMAEKKAIAIENRKLKIENEAWDSEHEQLLAKLAEYEAKNSKE